MDWDLAIKRNSEALSGIIEALFAVLGLVGEATISRIPPSLHSAVLRLLRPAESAVRRLIVIAARGLVVKLAPSRPMPVGPIGKGRHSRPSFQLFDPRKNFESLRRRTLTRNPPRIHFFGSDPRVAALWPSPQPAPDPAPRPMGSSMPNVSAAGSTPSNWRSMICRARPGVSRAGGCGARPQKLPQSSAHRSDRAIRPVIAGRRSTRSMRCSSNAMASPGTR